MIKAESYFHEVIEGRKRGVIASTLRFIFLFLSFGFQGFVTLRNYLYDVGIFSSHSPKDVFIISIGNIVTGGTGKTPSTVMLAQEFIKQIPLAIISRGYKSPAEKNGDSHFLSRGNGPEMPSQQCGDEPYLISLALPQAIVIVGKNRRKSAEMAVKAGSQLIICDDAMQHRQLYRDSEVVIINALDPVGQGYFLPRGYLRDSIHSLSRADLLILNHVISSEHFESLKNHLARYTKAPMIGTQLKVESIYDSNNQSITIKDKKVALFCGIAHPENFRKIITENGSKIVSEHIFPDHETFSAQDLLLFAEQAQQKGAELLVCTEKDFVKLQIPQKLPLSLAYLKMKLQIVAGNDIWKKYLNEIHDQISSKKSYSCEKM